jgi:hypothetical protein
MYFAITSSTHREIEEILREDLENARVRFNESLAIFFRIAGETTAGVDVRLAAASSDHAEARAQLLEATRRLSQFFAGIVPEDLIEKTKSAGSS